MGEVLSASGDEKTEGSSQLEAKVKEPSSMDRQQGLEFQNKLHPRL